MEKLYRDEIIDIPESLIVMGDLKIIKEEQAMIDIAITGSREERMRYELGMLLHRLKHSRGIHFCLKAFLYLRDEYKEKDTDEIRVKIAEEIVDKLYKIIEQENFGTSYNKFPFVCVDIGKEVTDLKEAKRRIVESEYIMKAQAKILVIQEKKLQGIGNNQCQIIEEITALRAELEALKAEKAGLQAGGDSDHTEEQGRKKDRGGYLGYSTTERAEALQILLEKALGREVVRDTSGAFMKIYSMIAGSSVETTGRYIRNCKGEKMLNEGRRKKAERKYKHF